MDRAPRAEMAALASARGRDRGAGGRKFYGWAIVSVADAASDSRTVEDTPTEANSYHADICLNLPDGLSDEGRRDRQIEHATDLARRARWEDAAAAPE